MPHDVFISHANEDKAVADMVCATLEQQGLRCWVAPRDIQPGTDWREAILGAIRSSRAIVLVFSKHANASRHIPREVECAVEAGIPLVPFRVEDVPPQGALEYNLIGVHWLDALTPPIEAHIRRLGDSLRAMLAPLRASASASSREPVPADSAMPEVRTTAVVSPKSSRASASRVTWLGVAGAAVVLSTAVWLWQRPAPPAKSPGDNPAPAPASNATPATSTTSAALDEARVAELRKASEDNPSDAAPRIELGNRYFDAERYQEAIPWYESALRLAPGNVNVSTDLAVSYYYINKVDWALAQIDASLAMNPDHPQALLNKGIILAFGKNSPKSAGAVWRKLIQVAPNSAEALAAQKGLDSLAKR
ncbi:MAG: TIR domain-containing protein [Acidobacteria bacterium]|nr:MAG: TIR domain-containing protein [Acidobacteriota bacterium]